jgi:hypothetical protein
MIFNRRKNRDANGSSAVAEPPRPEIAEARKLADDGELFEAIDLLGAANRADRDTQIEIEARRLRNLAGMELLAHPASDPSYAEPNAEVPATGKQSRIPETTPEGLSAEVLRASILSHGALLVRGLMDRDKALGMAANIDRSFDVRVANRDGGTDPDGYYVEMEPEPPYQIAERTWIEQGGGVLAVDSPRLLFDMLQGFEDAGLRKVIQGYLGEKPAISGQKCTLRKATPDVGGAWHQDGKFMGPVRSVNVWLSLSRCGDVAPSMDVVPKRLEEFVRTGGPGTMIENQIGQQDAEEAAGDAGIVRPIFEPGDALIFDHLFLHQTGSDPSMPNPRYAIESWFFGPSAYPENYVPIAF